MKISVVIPLYNKRNFISRALKSVMTQTLPAKEIIVVDDGSTDSSSDVVKTINDPRLRLIRQDNRGVSAARNLGAAEACNPLIAFLDADDAWEPRFLEIIGALRENFPQAGAYATNYEVISYLGKRVMQTRQVLPAGMDLGLINYLKVGLYSPVHSSAIMVPRMVLEQVGGFPEGESIFEDFDTWLRIALQYPIAWNKEIGSTVFQNAGNHTWDRVKMTREPIVSRTARRALQSGFVAPNKVAHLKEYVSYIQIAAARYFLLNGNKALAKKMLQYAKYTKEHRRWRRKIRILTALPSNFGSSILRIYEDRNLKQNLE